MIGSGPLSFPTRGGSRGVLGVHGPRSSKIGYKYPKGGRPHLLTSTIIIPARGRAALLILTPCWLHYTDRLVMVQCRSDVHHTAGPELAIFDCHRQIQDSGGGLQERAKHAF